MEFCWTSKSSLRYHCSVGIAQCCCRQEGSDVGLLRRKPVEVHTTSGEAISCYLYQATDQSPELEGLPSPQYLQVILSGAEEVGLPEDHQHWLKQQPHNGYQGEVGLPDSP